MTYDDPEYYGPLVHKTGVPVKFSELRVGDYVPGNGIVEFVNHDEHSFRFTDERRSYSYSAKQWKRLGFHGVRRNIIEEEPV